MRNLNTHAASDISVVCGLVDMEDFAATVRQAVVETFVSLDNDWITVGHMAGEDRSCATCIGSKLALGKQQSLLDPWPHGHVTNAG